MTYFIKNSFNNHHHQFVFVIIFRGNMSLSNDNRQNANPVNRLALKCEPFLEMKSIQPYPTKEEYIYAMKEDLSKWFNSIYSFPASSSAGVFNELNAINFLDELENGVLIALHANSIMKAAISKSFKFRHVDLKSAGIMNCAKFRLFSSENVNNDMLEEQNSAENLKKLLLISAMKRSQCGKFFGEYLLFKSPTIPKSLQARDNIVSFIKWCRHIVKVRECLMFEADDLIYRKNENNFILCLLEVARFGSQFGIEIPSSFRIKEDRLGFRLDNRNFVSLYNINNLGSLNMQSNKKDIKAIHDKENEIPVANEQENQASILNKLKENETEANKLNSEIENEIPVLNNAMEIEIKQPLVLKEINIETIETENESHMSHYASNLTLSNLTNRPKQQIKIVKSNKIEEKENSIQNSYETPVDIASRKRSMNPEKIVSHMETKKEKKVCIVSSYSHNDITTKVETKTVNKKLRPTFNLIDLTKLDCADDEKLKVGFIPNFTY